MRSWEVPSGRLQTRTWARGVATTYLYGASGERTMIDDADATPEEDLGCRFSFGRPEPTSPLRLRGLCGLLWQGRLGDRGFLNRRARGARRSNQRRRGSRTRSTWR